MDLIDIYRTFHPKTRIHFLLKCSWNILQERSYLGSNLGNFKKTENISSVFSDQNAMRLDISYRKKTVKNTNT